MYKNSGRTVKVFAMVLFALCLICAIAAYVVLVYYDMLFTAVVAAVALALIGFIGAVALYALGEASEKADRAAYYCEQLAKAANEKNETQIPILEDVPVKLSAKGFVAWLRGVCKKIFGYSVMATLFVGGLTVLAYVVALIVGGETAAEICEVTYKKVWPVIIKTANITILVGLLGMYLSGEKALSPSEKKKKLTKNNDAEGTDD